MGAPILDRVVSSLHIYARTTADSLREATTNTTANGSIEQRVVVDAVKQRGETIRNGVEKRFVVVVFA